MSSLQEALRATQAALGQTQDELAQATPESSSDMDTRSDLKQQLPAVKVQKPRQTRPSILEDLVSAWMLVNLASVAFNLQDALATPPVAPTEPSKEMHEEDLFAAHEPWDSPIAGLFESRPDRSPSESRDEDHEQLDRANANAQAEQVLSIFALQATLQQMHERHTPYGEQSVIMYAQVMACAGCRGR